MQCNALRDTGGQMIVVEPGEDDRGRPCALDVLVEPGHEGVRVRPVEGNLVEDATGVSDVVSKRALRPCRTRYRRQYLRATGQCSRGARKHACTADHEYVPVERHAASR